MLEGSLPEFATPLITPPPQAQAVNTHNGFTLAVRGVKFCGNGMRVAAAKASTPRPLAAAPSPSASPRPSPQRRRSTGGGRRAAAAAAGGVALVTTPVPTPLPPDVTSRLKAAAAERPRFCDRLAMFTSKSGEVDEVKDPYDFVDCSTSTTNTDVRQRPLQVNKASTASIPVNVVKPKRRKVVNSKSPAPLTMTISKTPALSSALKTAPLNKATPTYTINSSPALATVLNKPTLTSSLIKTPSLGLAPAPQVVRPKPPQFQSIIKPQLLKKQQQPPAASPPRRSPSLPTPTPPPSSSVDLIKETVTNSATSLLTPSAGHQPLQATSILRAPPGFNERWTVNEEKQKRGDEERSTTMNQLQAKIARNRVIGKHHRNNNNSSQERSLLEEQLMAGVKQEMSNTVTTHFTFPAKAAGSVVTYKKSIPLAQQPLLVPNTGMVMAGRKMQVQPVQSTLRTGIKKEKMDLQEHGKDLQRLANIRIQNQEFKKNFIDLGFGENASEDEAEERFSSPPFQNHWFLETPPECSIELRQARLDNTRAALRRRYLQLRKAGRCRTVVQGEQPGTAAPAVKALISAARNCPNRTAALLEKTSNVKSQSVTPTSTKQKLKQRYCRVRQLQCCMKDCTNLSLPLTRHCLRHIMYNVDQQLFEHCTATTQCRVPVFDVQHELPLCLEHALKKEMMLKQGKGAVETKQSVSKKSRRKSKPSAMTRPSKRGKKKKKSPAPTSSSPPISLPEDFIQQQQQPIVAPVQMATSHHHHQPQLQPQLQPQPQHNPQGVVQQPQVVLQQQQQQQQPMQPHHPLPQVKLEYHPIHPQHHLHRMPNYVPSPQVTHADMTMFAAVAEDSLSQPMPDASASLADNHASDCEEEVAGLLQQVEVQQALAAAVAAQEELPLGDLAHQASRLLEEEEEHDDLTMFLNQIPVDTLNELLNGERTGAYEPTREETEELERALAAVDKDVRSLEKLQRQHSAGGGTSGTLPVELVESLLGVNMAEADHPPRHLGVVKEDVHLSDASSGNFHNHLTHQNQTLAATATDMPTQLLPDGLVLDGTFANEAISQLDLSHPQTFLLPSTHISNPVYPSNDVSAFLQAGYVHQALEPQQTQQQQQQLLLTPAAVYGGGAAPPPTPNSAHQPAVANTPPFHAHNGYLASGGATRIGQFDAKFVTHYSVLPTSHMGTQTPADS